MGPVKEVRAREVLGKAATASPGATATRGAGKIVAVVVADIAVVIGAMTAHAVAEEVAGDVPRPTGTAMIADAGIADRFFRSDRAGQTIQSSIPDADRKSSETR